MALSSIVDISPWTNFRRLCSHLPARELDLVMRRRSKDKRQPRAYLSPQGQSTARRPTCFPKETRTTQRPTCFLEKRARTIDSSRRICLLEDNRQLEGVPGSSRTIDSPKAYLFPQGGKEHPRPTCFPKETRITQGLLVSSRKERGQSTARRPTCFPKEARNT